MDVNKPVVLNTPYSKKRKSTYSDYDSKKGKTKNVKETKSSGEYISKKELKNYVTAIVNKGREKKRLYSQVDEVQMDPYTGTILLNHSSGSGGNLYIFNSLEQGDTSHSRTGTCVQPISFDFTGLVRFGGPSNDVRAREIQLRVSIGFLGSMVDSMDENMSAFTTRQIFLKNGTPTVPAGDFTDLYRDYNWKLFRPFYDKVVPMQPPADLTFNSANPTYVAMTGPRDYARIKCHYTWPKNAKQMVYPSDTDTSYIANNYNIVVLLIARAMSDDAVVSVLTLETTAWSRFMFTDA